MTSLFTHGSLFSGIGGFDLAAEEMGWTNEFHCEWMPFNRRILSYYWPNAKSYEDITKSDFTIHRGTIDVLTGGFPCQPYSTAGKRLGKADERHLWPEMLRAIREIQPRYVVGENVSGLVNWNRGMVFEEVQADLEAEGYSVIPFLLPAASVNAPHKRERIWFAAYSNNLLHQRELVSARNRREEGRSEKCYQPKRQTSHRQWLWAQFSSGSEITSNSSSPELQGSFICRSTRKERPIEGEGRQFSRSIRSEWQNFPTQSPICGGDDGISTELDRTAILKHTAAKSERGSHFHRWRQHSIKGYGNAIVPQVALQIFKAIEAFERL